MKKEKPTKKGYNKKSPKRKFEGDFYHLDGELNCVVYAKEITDKIRDEQTTEAYISLKGATNITEEFVDEFLNLMFPLRYFKIKALKGSPAGAKKLFLETWKKKMNKYKSNEETSKIGHVLEEIEVLSYDSRPNILRGEKKAFSHKNKGKYTSTDYYVKDEMLYIFLRAKDKDEPNIWWSINKNKFNEDFPRHLIENGLLCPDIKEVEDFVKQYLKFGVIL